MQKIINFLRNRFGGGVKPSAFSMKGRKPAQEDAFYMTDLPENQYLAIVADGVGGHGHGDFASLLTVKTFQDTFENNLPDRSPEELLKQTSLKAAALVYNKGINEPDYKNCGTTLSGFWLINDHFFTINIGDSRVYHYQAKQLTCITKDHSEVQRLLDAGIITQEEARQHPRRHMMLSAIGQSLNKLTIDITGPHSIYSGDWLLVCSDGVHDALYDHQISSLIKENNSSSKLAETLCLEAYQAGGQDNITACCYPFSR